MKRIELELRARTQQRDFALLVCAAGICGLVRDSWPSPPHGQWVNLHAVFGLLLWVMVVVQFRRQARSSVDHEADFDPLCRRLSRSVYFLLYMVFAAQQVIGVAVLLWNHAPLGASHPAVRQPPENLRDFLAYGILALLTIRVLAALHRYELRRGALTSALADFQHHE